MYRRLFLHRLVHSVPHFLPLLMVDCSRGKHSSLGGMQVGDETPDVSPEALQGAWEATQQLLGERKISAGHDISDGGLVTSVLEMAFAGNCGVQVEHCPICVPVCACPVVAWCSTARFVCLCVHAPWCCVAQPVAACKILFEATDGQVTQDQSQELALVSRKVQPLQAPAACRCGAAQSAPLNLCACVRMPSSPWCCMTRSTMAACASLFEAFYSQTTASKHQGRQPSREGSAMSRRVWPSTGLGLTVVAVCELRRWICQRAVAAIWRRCLQRSRAWWWKCTPTTCRLSRTPTGKPWLEHFNIILGALTSGSISAGNGCPVQCPVPRLSPSLKGWNGCSCALYRGLSTSCTWWQQSS